MSDRLAPFRELLADRHGWLRRYQQETGRKVAGYFCDYVPEEILWAAGLTPVRITGGRGNVAAADQHLQSNVCSFARRCLEQALAGVYDYLDALVIPHTCDVITKMYDLWAYRLPGPRFLHYLWIPHKVFDRDAVGVTTGEFLRLRHGLEQWRGAPIPDAALQAAIQLYDQTRRLLQRVYELRRSDPPALSGEDAFAIALSALLAPKDVFNRWVEDFLTEREGNPSLLERRPRVVISASVLDDLELVRAVEAAGAWVVADEACTGTRYFWDVVGEVPGNPMSALVQRYLNKLPCPRSVGSLPPRGEHLQALARDYQAQGIIFYILRCCDAHLFQYPMLHQRLQQAGYKILYLQGDQTVGVNEGLWNRIQAFVEILTR